MTMTEMSTKPVSMTEKTLMGLKGTKLAVGRRVADDELWQRLDQKLAERDESLRGVPPRKESKGLFLRLIQGMGIRRA